MPAQAARFAPKVVLLTIIVHSTDYLGAIHHVYGIHGAKQRVTPGLSMAQKKTGHFWVYDTCKLCPEGAGWLTNLLAFLGIGSVWVLVNFGMCARLESIDTFLAAAQMANILGSMSADWPDSLGWVFSNIFSILDFDVDVRPT